MLDAPTLLNALFSLLFVLGLLLICAYALRRWRERAPALFLAQGAPADLQLSIARTQPIDVQRKLVLVRRGARMHLLLCSPSGDMLIESFTPHAPSTAVPPSSCAAPGEPAAAVGVGLSSHHTSSRGAVVDGTDLGPKLHP